MVPTGQHPPDSGVGQSRISAFVLIGFWILTQVISGVGSVTASALQIGMGMAALLAGLGATILLTGLGLVWATRPETARVKAPALRPATTLA